MNEQKKPGLFRRLIEAVAPGNKTPAAPSPRETLESMIAAHQLKKLEKAKMFLEAQSPADYWINAYSDVLDRYRDGGTGNYPISSPADRRYGVNFPFWTSEQQLGLLRAQARLCHTVSSNAQGFVNGLCSYVIRCGFTFRAVPKDGTQGTDQDAKDAQNIIKEFEKENAFDEIQQEAFSRSRVDGEWLCRMFDDLEHGKLRIRPIDPEHLIQPPGTDFREWSFGIQTDLDDIFNVKAYHVHYFAPGGETSDDAPGNMGEDVPAEDVVHIKVNVPKTVKRGLSDFSYDTLERFNQSRKLLTNLGDGAAVQAAIAGIRQHDTATSSQVDDFVQNLIDYSVPPGIDGTRGQDVQKIESGSFLDMPKGTNFVPPPGAANGAAHLAILQACLRSASIRHNAPEWLVSGDASSTNYSSSLTAESPFVLNCERLQRLYSRAFLTIIERALKVAAEAGRIRADILDVVEIEVETPKVSTQDRGAEAAADQVYLTNRVTSPQIVAARQGLDWNKVLQDWHEFLEELGPTMPGAAAGGPGEQGNPTPGMEGETDSGFEGPDLPGTRALGSGNKTGTEKALAEAFMEFLRTGGKARKRDKAAV